jgi:hypothetical protein
LRCILYTSFATKGKNCTMPVKLFEWLGKEEKEDKEESILVLDGLNKELWLGSERDIGKSSTYE